MRVIKRRSGWHGPKERSVESVTEVPVLSPYPTPPSGATFPGWSTPILQAPPGECTSPNLQLLVTPPCQALALQKGLLAAPNREVWGYSFPGEALSGDSVIELCSFETGAILHPLAHSARARTTWWLSWPVLLTPSSSALLSSVPQRVRVPLRAGTFRAHPQRGSCLGLKMGTGLCRYGAGGHSYPYPLQAQLAPFP